MPTLTARLLGITTSSTRNRVAILHPTLGFATLTITDPEVLHESMGRDWAELARQQDEPLLLSRGIKLPTFTLKAVVTGVSRFDTQPIATLQLLKKMAEDPQPVIVGYGTLEAGSFQIETLSWLTRLREPQNDDVTQADVTITLRKASTVPVTPGAAPPTPQQTSERPHRMTVKQGDTLYSISTAVYGTTAMWSKIADANGITDPRQLQAGQSLVMP